jgi:hypothetical protein
MRTLVQLLWVCEFPLQPFVHLDEIAKSHGMANGLVFIVCGLIGWTLSRRGATEAEGV